MAPAMPENKETAQQGIGMTIKKTASGYQVKSETKNAKGKRKNLSKSNLSLGEAKKRLEQVEWFKTHPKEGKQ